MAAYRIVHYLNQFFGGIGGEDKADYEPEVQEKVIGPGLALAQGLGDDYEIVATVICGDNYFGENLDEATDTIVEMVKRYHPDVFVAGPAFNAGRYGVACGTICKAVEERLGIPVVSGMYKENPGTDMFRQDVILVETGNSAATMRKAVPKFVNLIRKLAEVKRSLDQQRKDIWREESVLIILRMREVLREESRCFLRRLPEKNFPQTFRCRSSTVFLRQKLSRI